MSSSGQHSLCKVTHHPPPSHIALPAPSAGLRPQATQVLVWRQTLLLKNPPYLCPSPSTHIPSCPLLRSLGIACSDQGSCVGSVACDLVGVEERELASASEPLGDQSRELGAGVSTKCLGCAATVGHLS